MHTLVCMKAGDFDSIKVIEQPVPEPKDHEVQISVKAVALSASDFSAFTETFEKGKASFASRLLMENKPFGGDISGIITKTGKKVTSLKVGDEVYALIGVNGGCAEYVTAKAMGGIVTAVCSTKNMEAMYSLGADTVVDYTKNDLAGQNRQYDAILGVNGNISLKTYKSPLREHGTYVAVGGKSAAGGLLGPVYSLGSRKHMTFVFYADAVNHGHLHQLKEMAESGKIRPYMEKVFLPEDSKKEFERICKNHAKGKNVICLQFE